MGNEREARARTDERERERERERGVAGWLTYQNTVILRVSQLEDVAGQEVAATRNQICLKK